MDSSNPTSQIFIPPTRNHKPSLLNHPPKLLLTREALNTLNKILIAIPIPRNHLPNKRDGTEIPPLVDGIENRVIHLTELHASKDPTGLQHPERLVQRSLLVREIADPKHNRVQVDRGVGDMRHVLGVGFDEGQPRGVVVGCVDGALAAFGQHVGVDVADGDAGLEVVVDVCRVVEHAEGDVAGPAGDVEDVPAAFLVDVALARGEDGAWVERADEMVFPEAVDA